VDDAAARSKTLAKRLLTVPACRAAAVRAAGLRRHDLVLVYHRVVERAADAPWRVAPAVTADVLHEQLRVLASLGEVVPLEALLLPGGRRPRFAVTFDDDYTEHLRHALPVLQALGVPGTFFLGGRRLAGPGSYWWLALEEVLQEEGPDRAARMLGASSSAPADLALLCEGSAAAREAVCTRAVVPDDALLDGSGIAALASGGGVTVGFHTAAHPVMTRLDDAALDDAVTAGRERLERLLGRGLSLFAYPHGRAGAREAEAVRRAGFRAAWVGRPRPATRADPPYLRGRWEAGALAAGAFGANVAVRLHRAAP
jgi:peptidoglycan/xylan/chitin deacetylase (PgdA/CDA1 family)